MGLRSRRRLRRGLMVRPRPRREGAEGASRQPMNYWSDLFTPATYEAFSASDRTISGFRESQKRMAEKVQPGDKFICYMVRMSRWMGVLDVVEGPFTDNTPIFVPDDDPFVVRFKVT